MRPSSASGRSSKQAVAAAAVPRPSPSSPPQLLQQPSADLCSDSILLVWTAASLEAVCGRSQGLVSEGSLWPKQGGRRLVKLWEGAAEGPAIFSDSELLARLSMRQASWSIELASSSALEPMVKLGLQN